ncbi:peptidase S11 D-alanyl-D-alanine carboxypeptidase 1 [Haliangium ochraceum DSM 14365]|uniref:Peptidase S11 D-alanyl-D-alanine carboxypeptidase 1 n=1 Tax=Haliangium ochraceum (strain DSM 14365 / JCM 11303 / SMP-2) TaxID=502025 RepID=D0LZB2_HALO1|nr:peptidase S11 D-alanyl-D-alanine carboxypeptidase 1 [Haliangium ochraceum DSM 14365]
MGIQSHPGFVLPTVPVSLLAHTAAALIAAWILAFGAAPAGAQPFDLTTEDGLPNVQAPRAVILDAETGEPLFAKHADEVAAIASTGKIFVAMVVRERGIDLEAVTEISEVDRMYARGGARTRLDVGHGFRNIDLLRAMLVSSDNRAPIALGRAVGLSPEQLVAAMNHMASELGLRHTRFTCPSGLRGNVSTAYEMAIALRAALADPVLAEIMGTAEVNVRSLHSKPRAIDYRNTNLSLRRSSFEVLGGKTGFTRAAGYCLVVAARLAGRDVIMAFFGETHELTRFGDFERAARWLMAGRTEPPAGVGGHDPAATVASGEGAAASGGEEVGDAEHSAASPN